MHNQSHSPKLAGWCQLETKVTKFISHPLSVEGDPFLQGFRVILHCCWVCHLATQWGGKKPTGKKPPLYVVVLK